MGTYLPAGDVSGHRPARRWPATFHRCRPYSYAAASATGSAAAKPSALRSASATSSVSIRPAVPRVCGVLRERPVMPC